MKGVAASTPASSNADMFFTYLMRTTFLGGQNWRLAHLAHVGSLVLQEDVVSAAFDDGRRRNNRKLRLVAELGEW